MLDNDLLVQKVAAYKRESRKEFDKAVSALIALAFLYKDMGADFLWDRNPELNDKSNEICRNLSDTLAEKAKATALSIVRESLDHYDFDEAWDRDAEDEDKADWFVPILTRFDQQGSFLKELLEVWIALAFVYGLSQSELRIEISRFLANPFISRYWKDLPRDILKWGRGYPKDIAGQLAVIGQNAILSATRFAEWQDAKEKGAEYYIRRRGSNYDCDVCEDMANIPIPIKEPFLVPHSRCLCYPEYHFEPLPE